MIEAAKLTAFYIAMIIVLGFMTFASLKSCAESIDQDAQSAIAYQAQFNNTNEHEVYVRKLGER